MTASANKNLKVNWKAKLKFLLKNMNFLASSLITILILIGKVFPQSNGCDYYQALKPDVTYTITSPKYSLNYLRGSDCRWAAEAPPGYRILLSCSEVRLPTSFFCSGDRILVSNAGRADLRDATRHCGSSSFSETSASNRMTIALKTGTFSRGGKFKCLLKTVGSSCSCGQVNRGRIGEFSVYLLHIPLF